MQPILLPDYNPNSQDLGGGDVFDPRIQEGELDVGAMDMSHLFDPRNPEFEEAVRLTPATFAQYRTKGKWKAARHLQYIAAELAAELAQGDARIIVEVPPRHGKSQLISVHTPIWFLDRYPHLQVILTTYAADLSQRFGRVVRDNFLADGAKFLRAKIKPDVQRTDIFQTTEEGGMMSVGIGGPITGFGANLLIVDDYVKNFVEAISETINEATWNWFLSTAYTRLEPGGSVVVLATRWVLNDLIGRLKESTGEEWRVIRLPALAEAGDPLGRQIGEALWAERYPRERLLKIQSMLGSFLFDALYQQNPRNAADVTVDPEQLRLLEFLPDDIAQYRFVRSWDFAASEKTRADYTVGALLGTPGKIISRLNGTLIADMRRGQWTPTKVQENVLKTAEEDGKSVPIIIPQDPGAAGKAAAEHMANVVLKDYRVVIVPAVNTQKLVRANPYLAAVSAGRVAALKSHWSSVHKGELKEFPGGRHDDTVDAVAQGYNHLHQVPVLSPVWGRSKNGVIVPSQAMTAGTMNPSTLQRIGERQRKLVRGATWGRRRDAA
jgi:predicted phage terminase large subunit-like protein